MKKEKGGESTLLSKFESDEIQRNLDGFLQKREVLNDFFDARASKNESFTKKPENCTWCAKFRGVHLKVCLNCGTIIDSLTEVS